MNGILSTLFICQVLQPFYHLGCLLLDLLQPKLDTLFQVWSNKCQVQWNNHIPGSAGYTHAPRAASAIDSHSVCCPSEAPCLFQQSYAAASQTICSLYCCSVLLYPTCRTSNLSSLNLMQFLVAQSSSLPQWLCLVALPPGLSTAPSTLLSSADFTESAFGPLIWVVYNDIE